jgi:hypothetical protein
MVVAVAEYAPSAPSQGEGGIREKRASRWVEAAAADFYPALSAG